MEFPAMFYKAGGAMLLWDGEMFDYLIVRDDDEAKAAKADGYSFEKPKAEPAKPKSGDDDVKALRAAYKEKSGKAAFNGWDANALREKIAALSDKA